ncbi:MAG: cell division FtsA domain-containing protein [Candidatus Omnitrophota bacterium]|nr:rod shape-determining protein [Candidatus Omnitrophota bacterium]MBU1929481.1 rod shape-determining protein [Candidatus Omnitrophota bacterium]MBU2034942.1 rod shape-determining protein [Candidatus Omnitrophota bacterium]MBU2258885.1 rod shape-determining protein [Candidatus Omnitrophota bacterium]
MKEIFALDIGTRKVMGIIARKAEDRVEIIDVEVIEHSTRPMFDGQIHSIDEVAKTVKLIKERLESRLNKKLVQVGIAVAGRNLITYKSRVGKAFDFEQEITQELIRDLELEAVDNIVSDSGKNLSEYYCVGYSPIYYELDSNRISNLIGHKARSIATEVIVTLLPRLVLDSMFSVLKKAGLEATNITLEPISAINAIIPSEMRNLNIILVDVGAGTSDLALTKEGVIFAYGMVPEAGDEVTEMISEVLLVDFATAEKIKRSLNTLDEIEYEDIWSRLRRTHSHTLKQFLIPSVKKLAELIAKAGLELNGGIPQAVVVVGGGSLTFNLMEELADSFGLPLDKVGIRLPQAIRNIKDTHKKLTGPEAVTPIGIAQMTANSQGLRFIEVEVNGKKINILDLYQKKDVMGAIALSGALNDKKLYARPGMALTVKVNGELKVIKGTLGDPARIFLNGHLVTSLSEKVDHLDKIEFQPAVDGKDAKALIKDLVQVEPQTAIFNREILYIVAPIIMDGLEVSLGAPVHDRCEITHSILRVKDVLKFKDVKLEDLSERQILVNINGTPKILTQRNFTILVNNNSADLDAEVNTNDTVEFAPQTPTFYRIKDIIDIPEGHNKLNVNVDGKDLEIILEPVQVFMNAQQVRPEEFLIDGADIRVYSLKERQVLLSEIFRYIDFDPHRALGKRMKILVNDQPAGFTTLLKDGSKVNIILEDREE